MTDPLSLLQSALADRYALERELGRGGMATVYLAQDLKHDRPVAIKVLRPELATALGPERFLREIRIAGQLNHPHILGLIDSGEISGADGPMGSGADRPAAHSAHPPILFYVMPFVEGESLRDRLLREKQLPLEDALAIAREVADALGYAHSRGVVHRDIKPENILLSGGHAVVADFGIARALDTAGGTKLTETGLAIGTPAYMSPEQSTGEVVDGRSDVYSLGCVLYEMLAGQPPFTGPSAQAILARHAVDAVPPLETVRRTVPAEVIDAVEKALAKVPADRFATAKQFAKALTAGPPDRRTAGRERGAGGEVRRRRWLLPATVAVLATAAVGTWLTVRDEGSAVIPEASVIAVLPFSPVAPDSELEHLGYDLAGTMSASLDGIADLHTADRLTVLAQTSGRGHALDLKEGAALGRRLGASSVVYGTLARDGANVRLDLRLYASDSLTPVADPIVVVAPADSMTALSDSVTRILLKQVWRRGQAPTPSVEAALRTRSLPALRSLLQGERALVDNRWQDASDAYHEAFQADSTFWLAYWRYAYARFWMSEEVDSAVRTAYQTHRVDLPESDRLVVEANMTYGDSLSRSLAFSREATVRFPNNWFGWMDLGDSYVHAGPLVGTTTADAQAALEHAVLLNPRLVPAWEHLALMYLQTADTTGAARAYARLVDLNAGPSLSAGWNGSDYLLQLRLLLRLEESGGVAPAALMDSVVQEYARHGQAGTVAPVWYGYDSAQIQIMLAVRRIRGTGPYPSMRGTIAMIWATRGAWDSALAVLDRSGESRDQDPWGDVPGLAPYRMAVVAAWLGALDPVEALKRRGLALEAVRGLPVDRRAEVTWLDGMLAFSQGDADGFARARASLHQLQGADPGWNTSLEGFALALHGQTGAAGDSLAALEWRRAERQRQPEPPGSALTALDRIAAARWLRASGDSLQALLLLHWFEAYGSNGRIDWAVGPLALFERARIEEGRRDSTAARQDYERFLRVYDMPAPAHRQSVEDAKAALRRLSGQQDPPEQP